MRRKPFAIYLALKVLKSRNKRSIEKCIELLYSLPFLDDAHIYVESLSPTDDEFIKCLTKRLKRFKKYEPTLKQFRLKSEDK